MGEAVTKVSIGDNLDWPQVVDDLNRLLRLRTTPIGMKMFATRDEMEAIPKIRRPQSIPHDRPNRRSGKSTRLDCRNHRGGPRWRSVFNRYRPASS